MAEQSSVRPKTRERYYWGLSEEGRHRLFYREWGKKNSKHTIICVHGLTRLSRDFDALAAALSQTYRVICPDVVGRGNSGWLEHQRNYSFAQYCADMNTLIARLDVEEVHWVGTSMGGLIGLMLGAMQDTPIRSLVLNDVGPELKHSELLKMGNYVGRAVYFKRFEDLLDYYRETYRGMGEVSDSQWRKLAEYSAVQEQDGYRLHYDPKIGDAFRSAYSFMHFNLWKYWSRVTCPTLTLRGGISKFLSAATASKMIDSGPGTRVVEIDNVGHAPRLSSDYEIGVVQEFLDSVTLPAGYKLSNR